MIIKGKVDISGIKRCYIEDVKDWVIECPECKNLIEYDWDNYISYPEVDEMDTMGVCCYGCDNVFIIPFKLKNCEIKLQVYSEKIEKDY